MIDSILNQNYQHLLEKLAIFSERRHEVLSGNLANINTPEYRTRDLPVEDFQAALAEAVRPTSMSGMQGHQSNLLSEEMLSAIEATSRNVTFHDGGNRSVEHELTEITKNMLQQQLSVQLMQHQFRMLSNVISERVV